ncbi:MAG: bifunctional 4-hydroxy-2-oxoglutarate aldolase/2-dehydro-3-deoxy-phosphogluconate aldolase [Bacteroidales bacterium]
MVTNGRSELIRIMKETAVVPVFFHPDPEVCKNVVRACYNGGIRVFEFVNRGDDAHEIFSHLNRYVRKELPDLFLGAGSVVDASTADLFIQMGARFIVSPLLSEETGKLCNRRGVAWLPGCGTVTEIGKALELGAEIIKIFPASELGGPPFVKAVKGPMPWVNLMPAGGVDTGEAGLRAWFEAGVACVGIGSKLFPRELIDSGNFRALTEKVRKMVESIKRIKK